MKGRARSKEILSKLYEQGFRCAYTGDPLTPEDCSADHVIPVASGGEHSIENIALVLSKVNVAKGILSLPEFVLMCRKVARHFEGREEFAAPVAALSLAEVLSGCDDPVEILAKHGYLNAAEKVRDALLRLSTSERRKRKTKAFYLGPEEYTKDRLEIIERLEKRVGLLRVEKATLKRFVGRNRDEVA